MITTIKKPDLSAPRFRPSSKNIMDRAFFREFKKKYPQHALTSDATIRNIIYTYNQKIWETAVNERDGAEFPQGLGYLFIGSCKSPKKFNVDVNTSIELDVRVRHRNFESDNFLAKIFYTNFASKYHFRHRNLWQFKGARDFTRSVSVTYPIKWKQYLQVDNYKMISKIFREYKEKERRTGFIQKRIMTISEEYNEFDMN